MALSPHPHPHYSRADWVLPLDTGRGVYLTDLVFIEDGNPDESEGLVNFYKVCAPLT